MKLFSESYQLREIFYLIKTYFIVGFGKDIQKVYEDDVARIIELKTKPIPFEKQSI